MPVNTSPSASRRVLVIIALTLFIVALILVVVSTMLPGSGKKLSFAGGSFADGYKAARDQAYQLGFPKGSIASLVGTVESVSGGSVVIKTDLFVDQRVDGIGQSRTILVDGSTKIVKRIQKSQDEINKDLEAFMQSAKNADPQKPSTAPVPPQPFTQSEIKVTDLKKGDEIIVRVEGNEDLTLKDRIKAASIDVSTANVKSGEPKM